jgi:hypothetical protein
MVRPDNFSFRSESAELSVRSLQQGAVDALQQRLESHGVRIRQLKEENLQLCQHVAMLLGERPCQQLAVVPDPREAPWPLLGCRWRPHRSSSAC